MMRLAGLADCSGLARVVANTEVPMRFLIRPFAHSLKFMLTVLLAAVLCGWFAADPRAALRFWSGVLIGVLGVIVGWRRLKATSARRANRRFKIFSVILSVWCALAFVPQRDVPIIAAPFGVWLALTVAMAFDLRNWRRSPSVPSLGVGG